MATTTGALGSLGSDLAFSVSFGIANELVAAASEANLSEDELIGMVLVVTVLLAALPSSFTGIRKEWHKAYGGQRKAVPDSGILEFMKLLLNMAHRISLSICVQLVSSNVRSKQPLRSVRVVSLLAVSIFFLFLESTSSVGNKHR
jgi:hypothetical protein